MEMVIGHVQDSKASKAARQAGKRRRQLAIANGEIRDSSGLWSKLQRWGSQKE